MRLNEQRIDAIALAIVDRLAEEEMVDLTMEEEQLADLISELIAKDLSIEEDLQREAVEWLRVNKKHLEEGTSPWSIELERRREDMALRRGYVLP